MRPYGKSMDNIKFTFSRTAPTSDGSSINYIFDVSYGSRNWEIAKRFSEFEFLLEQVCYILLSPPEIRTAGDREVRTVGGLASKDVPDDVVGQFGCASPCNRVDGAP